MITQGILINGTTVWSCFLRQKRLSEYFLAAAEYVEKHCGLVLGGTIHSSLPFDEVDWEFPIHPRIGVGKATLRRNRRCV
jgi:hypothetical protein